MDLPMLLAMGGSRPLSFDITTAWDDRGISDVLGGRKRGSAWADSGNKLYTLRDDTGPIVEEWNLSVPYDVTTAVLNHTYDAGAAIPSTNSFYQLRVSPDGTHFYFFRDNGFNAFDIEEFSMTANTLSTASYVRRFSETSAVPSITQGMFFNSTGTRLYTNSPNGNGTKEVDIRQYNLGTPWNLSTAVLSNFISTDDTVWVSTGGYWELASDDVTVYRCLYPGVIQKWQMSVADDISTLAYVSQQYQFITISEQNPLAYPTLSPDGTVCLFHRRVDQATVRLGTAFDFSTRLGKRFHDSKLLVFPYVPGYWFYKPDASSVYSLGRDLGSGKKVKQHNMTIKGNLGTATEVFEYVLPVLARTLWFSHDGTKMFTIDNASSPVIRKHDLSTAWDLSTAVEDVGNTLTVPSATFNNAWAIATNPSGSKLFIVYYDSSPDASGIAQYSMSPSWDLTSVVIASPSDTFDLITASGSDIAIQPDGQTVLISDYGSYVFEKYMMSTAWDLTTIAATGITINLPYYGNGWFAVPFIPENGGFLFLADDFATGNKLR